MKDSSVFLEFKSLPDELKQQVADFISFLKHKSGNKNKPGKREFGFAKGKIKLSKDFDAPLEDFKEYM